MEFVWQEKEEAWLTLKDELVKAPILAYPGPNTGIFLDASGFGIRAVLSQVQEGREHLLPMEVKLKQRKRDAIVSPGENF